MRFLLNFLSTNSRSAPIDGTVQGSSCIPKYLCMNLGSSYPPLINTQMHARGLPQTHEIFKYSMEKKMGHIKMI